MMSTTNTSTWGSRLTELRTTLNWPAVQIVEYTDAGYTKTAYDRYNIIEQQNITPSDYFLDAICRSFYVNPEWIRSGKGQMLNDSRRIRLSQVEIHSRAGIKRGVMSLKTLISISDSKDVGLEWLICGDEIAKEAPVNENMVSYLRGREDIRRAIWKQMGLDSTTWYEELKTIRVKDPVLRVKIARSILGYSERAFGTSARISLEHITKLTEIQISKISLTFNVSRDWIRTGNTASLAFPCDQKMIIWLREHPEVRREIRRSMNAEAVIR